MTLFIGQRNSVIDELFKNLSVVCSGQFIAHRHIFQPFLIASKTHLR
ncbi:Uncharacterised protein [Vibrio cholerae]|nr:Uncharacterised protein [Vibrio cholerae]